MARIKCDNIRKYPVNYKALHNTKVAQVLFASEARRLGWHSAEEKYNGKKSPHPTETLQRTEIGKDFRPLHIPAQSHPRESCSPSQGQSLPRRPAPNIKSHLTWGEAKGSATLREVLDKGQVEEMGCQTTGLPKAT